MGGMISNMKDQNVMDPNEANWGDLDRSEKTARVLGQVGGGLRRIDQGLNSQPSAPRQGGGAPPITVTPNPQIDTGYNPNFLMNNLRQNQNPYSAFGR